MSTISAISRNAYLTFKLSQENSSFASIVNRSSSANNLLGTSKFPGMDLSSNTDALQAALSNRLTEQKDTITRLEDYHKTSDAFYSKFFPKMNDLNESANTLKKTNFSENATSNVLSNIKQFASDYNQTVTFLGENSKTSNNISNLSTSFASPKYNSRAFQSIGIDVDTTGKLNIDEGALTSALRTDPTRVKQLLGSDGLAGQTYNKTNVAINNAANLVPFPKLSNSVTNGLFSGMLVDLFA